MVEKKHDSMTKKEFVDSLEVLGFENKNQALMAEIAYSLYCLRNKK